MDVNGLIEQSEQLDTIPQSPAEEKIDGPAEVSQQNPQVPEMDPQIYDVPVASIPQSDGDHTQPETAVGLVADEQTQSPSVPGAEFDTLAPRPGQTEGLSKSVDPKQQESSTQSKTDSGLDYTSTTERSRELKGTNGFGSEMAPSFEVNVKMGVEEDFVKQLTEQLGPQLQEQQYIIQELTKQHFDLNNTILQLLGDE